MFVCILCLTKVSEQFYCMSYGIPSIREQLSLCCPNLDFTKHQEAIICKTCKDLLNYLHSFTKASNKNYGILQKYINLVCPQNVDEIYLIADVSYIEENNSKSSLKYYKCNGITSPSDYLKKSNNFCPLFDSDNNFSLVIGYNDSGATKKIEENVNIKEEASAIMNKSSDKDDDDEPLLETLREVNMNEDKDMHEEDIIEDKTWNFFKQCPHCDQRVSRKRYRSHLGKHVYKHKTKTVFKCKLFKCPKLLKTMKELKDHYKEHYLENKKLKIEKLTDKDVCNIIGGNYNPKQWKQVTCKICKEKFKFKSLLMAHEVQHHRFDTNEYQFRTRHKDSYDEDNTEQITISFNWPMDILKETISDICPQKLSVSLEKNQELEEKIRHDYASIVQNRFISRDNDVYKPPLHHEKRKLRKNLSIPLLKPEIPFRSSSLNRKMDKRKSFEHRNNVSVRMKRHHENLRKKKFFRAIKLSKQCTDSSTNCSDDTNETIEAASDEKKISSILIVEETQNQKYPDETDTASETNDFVDYVEQVQANQQDDTKPQDFSIENVTDVIVPPIVRRGRPPKKNKEHQRSLKDKKSNIEKTAAVSPTLPVKIEDEKILAMKPVVSLERCDTPDKKTTCPFCKTPVSDIIFHISKNHGYCPSCLAPMKKDPVIWKGHLKLCEKTQFCPDCFSFFQTSIELSEHGDYNKCKKAELNGTNGVFRCHKCYTDFNQWCMFDNHQCENSKYKKRAIKQPAMIEVLPCSLCNESLTPRVTYQHYYSHLGQICHECPCCAKKFVTKRNYIVHFEANHLRKMSHCFLCKNSALFNMTNLVNHLIQVHGDTRLLECPSCKAFVLDELWKDHMKNANHLFCRTCPQIFPNRDTLAWHTRVKSTSCFKCNIELANQCEADKHASKEHNIRMKVAMEYCLKNTNSYPFAKMLYQFKKGKMFAAFSSAVDHSSDSSGASGCLTFTINEEHVVFFKNRHVTKKNFVDWFLCHSCDMFFPTRSIRDHHINLRLCSKQKAVAMRRDPNRAIEQQILENDQSTFIECDKCEETVSKVEELLPHKLLVHCGYNLNAKQYCQICDYTNVNSSRVSDHMHTHFRAMTNTKIVCLECDVDLDSADLQKHYNSHADKKTYYCKICNLHFRQLITLVKHSTIHNKNHYCTLCSVSFKDIAELIYHIDTHTELGDNESIPEEILTDHMYFAVTTKSSDIHRGNLRGISKKDTELTSVSNDTNDNINLDDSLRNSDKKETNDIELSDTPLRNSEKEQTKSIDDNLKKKELREQSTTLRIENNDTELSKSSTTKINVIGPEQLDSDCKGYLDGIYLISGGGILNTVMEDEKAKQQIKETLIKQLNYSENELCHLLPVAVLKMNAKCNSITYTEKLILVSEKHVKSENSVLVMERLVLKSVIEKLRCRTDLIFIVKLELIKEFEESGAIQKDEANKVKLDDNNTLMEVTYLKL